ncbi:MAG: serine/threonine-protein kinase [Polyangiales bacterium]
MSANDGVDPGDVPSIPPPDRSGPPATSSPFFGNTLVGVPPPPAKTSAPRNFAVGAVYAGDFRIVRALAKGGMGAVFEVDQISTGRRRALKIIRVPGALDVATRERFLREARASAMIDSPHVVEVVVAGTDDATSTLWIAMEYLVGETLADRMARLDANATLPQRESWVVLTELLRGLARAHARGVVHRDLKPTNVFLARTNGAVAPTVKILDFGIACFHDGQEHKLTDPIGTPLWMAPEQSRPSRITPSVDVWAVGLIAFRLFAGRSYWLAARDASPNVRDVLAELLYEPLRERLRARRDPAACADSRGLRRPGAPAASRASRRSASSTPPRPPPRFRSSRRPNSRVTPTSRVARALGCTPSRASMVPRPRSPRSGRRLDDRSVRRRSARASARRGRVASRSIPASTRTRTRPPPCAWAPSRKTPPRRASTRRLEARA